MHTPPISYSFQPLIPSLRPNPRPATMPNYPTRLTNTLTTTTRPLLLSPQSLISLSPSSFSKTPELNLHIFSYWILLLCITENTTCQLTQNMSPFHLLSFFLKISHYFLMSHTLLFFLCQIDTESFENLRLIIMHWWRSQPFVHWIKLTAEKTFLEKIPRTNLESKKRRLKWGWTAGVTTTNPP